MSNALLHIYKKRAWRYAGAAALCVVVIAVLPITVIDYIATAQEPHKTVASLVALFFVGLAIIIGVSSAYSASEYIGKIHELEDELVKRAEAELTKQAKRVSPAFKDLKSDLRRGLQ